MRVVYTLRPDFGTQTNAMLVDGLKRSAPVLEEAGDNLVLSTARPRLEVERLTGVFTWTDSTGQLLVREPRDRQETKMLEEVDVLRTVISDDTDITTVRGADGERAVVTNVGTVVDRKAYSTTLRLEFADGEAIYGLGQHEDGILNYRGHHEYLYQQNIRIVAPMIVSTRGYGILWDSQSLASFHDDQHGTYFWTEIDDEMDFLFVMGPEFDDIVGQVRRLTGEAPMLPRWALGYIQSKDRYVDAAELLDVVSEFRTRQLPIDCIVQDWQHWPEGHRLLPYLYSLLGWTTHRHYTPLDRIPVFVRAGTILPLGPVMQHTDEDPWGPVELRNYPGSDGAFDLYEDAGDGDGYERRAQHGEQEQWRP